MERKTPDDAEPVYVRVGTEYGLVSMHAETLILDADGEDTLYGEIVATTDESRTVGDMFEVRIDEVDNDLDVTPFFLSA